MTDKKNVLGWQDLDLGSFSSEGKKINFTELDFLEVWRTVVDSDMDLTSQTLVAGSKACLLYTSPSPRDAIPSRMPSSA